MKRGFRCVGPTVVYSFMQVAGLVNDHLVTCYRYNECAEKVIDLSYHLSDKKKNECAEKDPVAHLDNRVEEKSDT